MPGRILVIDDESQITRVLRAALSAQGYDVRTANDPEEGLRMFKEWTPDLVITDLMMSEVDSGFSFSRRLRDDPRTAAVPIIMSTSVTTALGLDFTPHSAADLDSMKIDAYFDKPLDATALVAKVRELLGEPSC